MMTATTMATRHGCGKVSDGWAAGGLGEVAAGWLMAILLRAATGGGSDGHDRPGLHQVGHLLDLPVGEQDVGELQLPALLAGQLDDQVAGEEAEQDMAEQVAAAL